MRFLILTFLALSSSLAFAANGLDQKREWYACEEDTDCIIGGDFCGGVESSRKDAQNEHNEWLNKVRPALNCRAPSPILDANQKKLKPICSMKKCSAALAQVPTIETVSEAIKNGSAKEWYQSAMARTV